MAMQITHELSICECCVFIIEYGECEHGVEECPAMGTFDPPSGQLVNGDEDQHHGFRWHSRCDTCGETLGGNRYHAVALGPA